MSILKEKDFKQNEIILKNLSKLTNLNTEVNKYIKKYIKMNIELYKNEEIQLSEDIESCMEHMKSKDFVFQDLKDLDINMMIENVGPMKSKLLEFGKKVEKIKFRNEELKRSSVLMKQPYTE